jgi:hypothetical protein
MSTRSRTSDRSVQSEHPPSTPARSFAIVPLNRVMDETADQSRLMGMYERVCEHLEDLLQQIPEELHTLDKVSHEKMVSVTNRMDGHNWRINVEVRRAPRRLRRHTAAGRGRWP